MRSLSDSGTALLLWDFILAMAASKRDLKLRKLSLLPRFFNKKILEFAVGVANDS